MSDNNIKASIVMATRNKAKYLRRTLQSIFDQSVPFAYEIIIINDGSTDETHEMCKAWAIDNAVLSGARIHYTCLQNTHYRNPSHARNVGYRLARGEVIIAQSDEVIHSTPNTIERLTNDLQPRPAGQPGEFLIATVYNYDPERDRRGQEYTGLNHTRPFFFLGSLWRSDLYAAGGNDEEFTEPGYDDDWFGLCLMRGLGLTPRFLSDVIGLHQVHERPRNLPQLIQPSRRLFEEKCRRAEVGEIPYQASGGPWEFHS